MNEGDRTLWMGDLESYMDSDFIGEAFQLMGESVHNVKVVHDRFPSRGTAGYCFVELSDGESARRAMLHINGKVIPNSKPAVTFNLSFANSPSAPYTEYNLFVNNIPLDLEDAGLFLVFGDRYRSCRGAKVYRNSDGSSKGLGFIRFADQTDQQKALVEMNKMIVHGREILLKLAQPKFRSPRGSGGGMHGGAPGGGNHHQQQPEPLTYYPPPPTGYQLYNPVQMYAQPQPQQMYLQPSPQMAMMPGGGGAMMFQPTYVTTTGAGGMMTMLPPPQQQQQQPQYLQPQQQPATYVNTQSQQMVVEDDQRFAQSTSGQGAAPLEVGGDATTVVVVNGGGELEFEPYVDVYRSADEANCVYMEHSDDLYAAMERSRWFPQLQTASACEADFS